MTAGLIALVFAILVVVVLVRTIRIIPQARAGVVERLGSYSRTLVPGPHVLVPFVDRIRSMIDLRDPDDHELLFLVVGQCIDEILAEDRGA